MQAYKNMCSVVAAVCAFVVISIPGVSTAHPLDPALLEMKEASPHVFEVVWKTPVSKLAEQPLKPLLPVACRVFNEMASEVSNVSLVQRFRADCAPSGLAGGTLKVQGLDAWKTDALLRIELMDGSTVRAVLREGHDSFLIPVAQGPWQVVHDYIALGIEHILSGWDHLLFVLGLVLLVRNKRTLLWTITAFTVGHSVTLSLAALGLVQIPPAPVEVLIALSILVVAVELLRSQDGGKVSFGSRYPPVIAVIFGFLHGLGFAGALAEVGLPAKEIPLALLTFNIGIEIGQLIFVAAVLMVIVLLRRWRYRWPSFVYALPAYVIGSLSSFWIFDRITKL